MQFFATVKINPDTQEATPTIRVKHEMTKREGGVTDGSFYEALKGIKDQIRKALENLPASSDAAIRYDIWLNCCGNGEKYVNSLARFGDQQVSHGYAELGFLRERIIEVMTENTDNWSRKPAGCWTFDREFSLEPTDGDKKP